jgi:hypothetical protein
MLHTYRLRGAITGDMWMGGRGAILVDVRLSRNEHEPFADYLERGMTRESLDSVLARHGGDFQGPRFTEDTMLTIESRSHTRHTSVTRARSVALVDLPSVADLVEADIYVTDFMGEDY